MRHSGLLVAAVAVLGVLAACSGAQPCPTCPALEGTWSMSWSTGARPPGCTAQGPRPATLNLVQNQSDLRTVVEGQDLKGTIFDTWDFTLNGGDTAVTYSLRGRALSVSADAGVRIEGTLTTVGECAVDDTFLGLKL